MGAYFPVFAVGASGTILLSTTATTWLPRTGAVATDTCYNVWASSLSDIYVVGKDASDNGKIWHSTGTTVNFTAQTLPAGTGPLFGVWGADASHVYAVGPSGTILFSMGNGTWTKRSSGTTDTLKAWGGAGVGE